MSTLFSLDSPLSEFVLDAFADPHKAQLMREHNYAFYEGRIWVVLNRLNSLDDEIQIIFSEISAPKFPAHASLLLKMYIVTLDTMSDVLAWLISEVFDLGYNEKQISMSSVLNNRHVVASGISAHIRSHLSATNYSDFSRQRNDIVHRGLIIDHRLSDLDGMLLNHIASHLDDDISIRAGYRTIQNELAEYCADKREELKKHYGIFLDLVNTTMEHLADETRKRH